MTIISNVYHQLHLWLLRYSLFSFPPKQKLQHNKNQTRSQSQSLFNALRQLANLSIHTKRDYSPISMPRRSSSSPPLLNPPILLILLPIIALLLFFFLFPPFLSTTTPPQKLRSNSVKKSWDSLNIFLVLFAILCGVFAAKNKNDDESVVANNEDVIISNISNTNNNNNSEIPLDKTEQSSTLSWFDGFSDQKLYGTPPANDGGGRLRRSSSSYPDLRKWENEEEDYQFRFFDDFDISKYASSAYNSHHHRRRSKFQESPNIKEIPVDTFVLRSSPLSSSPTPPPPPKSPSPAPPPPPPPPPRTAERRTYKTVPRKEEEGERNSNCNKIKSPPPPPPPPRPPPQAVGSEKKGGKGKRKKTNATKEIKMVLASLYNQRKRKRKQKTAPPSPPSEPASFTQPQPSPPPPPPPPPPPSMFYSLFRKGSKSKKIHSFSSPPPPPPPPSRRKSQVPPRPPASPQPSRLRNSASTGRPPLPTRANNAFYEENVNSGGQSPLIPMPPPPPPFKVQGFPFVVSGDFVKIGSNNSSRCGSPEFEGVEKEALASGGDDGGGGVSVTCPSPDVNIKADSFIARLRDEWRLEKINSLREKRTVGLGPDPGPAH